MISWEASAIDTDDVRLVVVVAADNSALETAEDAVVVMSESVEGMLDDYGPGVTSRVDPHATNACKRSVRRSGRLSEERLL